ncbi:MAG: TolC family protein [Carboxylicivirga sp.]|jgi:outer membrane protein TolC|nr:TolC family protein [Carboxylicivirga sp.]
MKRNKMLASILLAVCCLLPIAGQHRLSLDEALIFAYKNNRNIQISQKNIDASNKQKWEVISDGLPKLDGNINYNNWLKQQMSLLPGAIVQQPDIDFVPVAFGTKHSINSSLTLSQMIFDRSYFVAIQSAKLALKSSEYRKEKVELQIREQVTLAYVNVLIAEESIVITQKNIADINQNLSETQQLLNQGLTEEENVEQLKITHGELQNNLLGLKHQEAVARGLLKILLGLELTNTLELSQSFNQLLPIYMTNANQEEPYPLNKNIDYRLASNAVRNKELELKLQRSRSLPSLNLSVQSSAAGYGNKLNDAGNVSDMLTANLLALNLKIPLFHSFKRNAAAKRKIIELSQKETEFKELEQQLFLELRKAQDALSLSLEQYNTTKENLQLSERIARKNQTKFNNGLITSFDLRQAQQQLYTTQREYLKAAQAIVVRKVELERIINK